MLRFIDGFDHYAIADILGKWTTHNLTGTSTIGGAIPARTGGACLILSGNATNGEYVSLASTGGAVKTLFCGFGFRYAYTPTTIFFLCFGDQGVGQGQCQIGITLNSGGTLSAWRNASSASNSMRPGSVTTSGCVLLGSTPISLAINQWNYIEVLVVIGHGDGTVKIDINGVEAMNLPPQDTQFTPTAAVNVIALAGGRSTDRHAFDDLYVGDTAAGDDVSFLLGPQRVLTNVAQPGNGSLNNFTPSTGTDHGAVVDDPTPNADVDYNFSSTVGHRDSYHFPPMPLFGRIRAIQASQWVRTSESGARAVANFVRVKGINHDGSPTGIDTTYRAVRNIWTHSPDTGLDWTVPEIDQAEFGIVVQS